MPLQLSSLIPSLNQYCSHPCSPGKNLSPTTKSAHYQYCPPLHHPSDSANCPKWILNSIPIAAMNCPHDHDLFGLLGWSWYDIDEHYLDCSWLLGSTLGFQNRNHCFGTCGNKGRSASMKWLASLWLIGLCTRSLATWIIDDLTSWWSSCVLTTRFDPTAFPALLSTQLQLSHASELDFWSSLFACSPW